MLGLALGSWIMGSFISKFVKKHRINTLYIYAFAELGIGIGAFVVPKLFLIGKNWLLSFGETNSFAYLVLSALVIALIMLPWCFLMGTTIPLIIEFMRNKIIKDVKVFSYLYLANTIGAIFGVIVSVFVLIELFGFNGTLFVAATLNTMLFIISLIISKFTTLFTEPENTKNEEKVPGQDSPKSINILENYITLPILFLTGFISMGLEVLWTRMFTPIIETSVYAFATILFLYLFGTCVGLWKYRIDSKKNKTLSTRFLLNTLIFSLLAQIILNDPRLNLGIYGIILSVLSFSCILGYLTPKQIDIKSRGSSAAVGKLYAINILGCIIGPLIASYFLLPFVGAKSAIILLCLPLVYFIYKLNTTKESHRNELFISLIFIFLICNFFITTYEDGKEGPNKVIKRDYNATVTAYKTDRRAELLVNGFGMTSKTTITKIMAHLPLILTQQQPSKVLTICFGMGTTYRSMMSWGIDTTAIELTPSVAKLFPYFFSDADAINKNLNGHIIIDDGRRYLQRSNEIYDVIAIDPPPPAEAAGSSLLYSREFYEIAKKHLSEKGILAQWYPGGNDLTLNAISRSIVETFPYAVAYRSAEGWGYHLLASRSPISSISPEQFLKKIPQNAKKDLMEWNFSNLTDLQYAQIILSGKIDIKNLLNNDKSIEVTDNQPFNEYYLLRKNGLILSK